MTGLGVMLFHGDEFSEGEISPGVDHYPPRRDVVSVCLFIDYFCLSQGCVFWFVLQAAVWDTFGSHVQDNCSPIYLLFLG